MRADDADTTLNALIRRVADAHPGADVAKLAALVRESTPPESLMGYYEASLTAKIYQLIGKDRRHVFEGPGRGDRRQKYRSPNVAERRSWWDSLLRERVVAGGNVLMLGDCGEHELILCIEERRKQIAGFQTQIMHFEHLLELLATHKKTKVKDLPAQTSWPS